MPTDLFCPAFLNAEQERHPGLRILAVQSAIPPDEPICWYRYKNFVFFGSFGSLSHVNIKAYVMSL